MASQNGGAPFYCEVCEEEVHEGSRNVHEQGAVHMARKNYKERLARRETWMKTKSIQGLHAFTGVKTDMPRIPMDLQVKDWIPVAKQPLLGMEHVVEVMQYQNSGPRYYVCKMCGIGNIQVFEHITSVGHRLQYLVNHHDEVKEYIEKAKLTEDERQVLDNIIESKGWPTEEMLKKGSSFRPILLDLAVKITSGMKRKRFQMAIETQHSGLRRPRQKCLSEQIQGHTEDHYPPYLVERLYFYGANFAYPSEDDYVEPLMPAEQGYTGGWGAPQPAPGEPAQRRPLTMGEAKRQADERLTFLNWLQITQQKIAAEPVTPQDVTNVKTIISLLECGMKIYQDDPRPAEICYYTQGPVNPEMVDLSSWIQLTTEFFESAWLCSERELTAATALIEQMRRAVSPFQRPHTMGGSMDPYDTLPAGRYDAGAARYDAGEAGFDFNRRDPYRAPALAPHPHPHAGAGDPFAQGYGRGRPSRQFAEPPQNRGRPYERPQGGRAFSRFGGRSSGYAA